MFRTVPLSTIRSFSLYTQQWYMSYRFADRVPSLSCSQAVSKPVWHIPLLCVQWKTPDDGQVKCPKHVEFYSKNKFEKLVYLVGFIMWTYKRCTVTWTSKIIQVCWQLASRIRTELCVQWKTPDDVQRNCPKHVVFYSKNWIWEISASSWFYYKNLSRCTVTWTSKYFWTY